MKSQEAQRLIKQTFENPFNKTQFIHFINNLLKDEYEEKAFIQTGAQLPDAFFAYIRKMERVGKYEDASGNFIDILLVELKRDHSIEYARTAQRNFIRRYLNGSRGGELKDAAIVAFYTEGSEDWRFSLIKMQYSLEKKKDELTPAKRFSFLVGKNEKSHTAQKQLAGLLTMDKVPILADIENAFNIETVTIEFFDKYKEQFLRVSDFFEKQLEKNRALKTELTTKNIDHVSFTKKLLGQIVFLYFLQKKGWLGVDKNGKWGEGDKKFLRSLSQKATAAKKNYYTDYLQYLFYEALAEERRNTADPSYYRLLDCKIPFLNGGLFEADYDWKNITVKIPNDFFTNENSTKEGDTGDGILDVFDRYNFTVKEDEPLDKEVAVDPEMLGKVFEKLLEVKDRKSKGAFYTPREIVHYMCQESLINYLDTSLNNGPAAYQKLGTSQTDMFGNKVRKGQLALEAGIGAAIKVPKADLEKFIREGNSAIDHDARVEKKGKETITYSYLLPENIRAYATDIDKALADVRVCDPAIGSGAFPVGIMNEIVKAREILTTYLPVKKQKERTAYELKRHCIQESIYGVDIDHSAINIAKLRLWLSLVVDEQDLSTVKPLPNLDYKIVYGNSLIGMPEGSFRNAKLEDEIQALKEDLFNETNKPTKDRLREKIYKKIRQLLDSAEQFAGYKIDFDFKLFFSEVFHEKKGFDVVIGNPPYVKVQNLSYEIIDLYKRNWSTAWKRIDISTLFMELGFSMLNSKGHLCFISSNQFIAAEYGRMMRKYLLQKGALKSIVDFGDLPVFDNALTYVSVFLLSKKPKKSFDYHRIKELPFELPAKFSSINLLGLSEEPWSLGEKEKLSLIKKIQSNYKKLENYAKCSYGIISGSDEIFILNKDKIKKLKIEKQCLIPLLRANNCGRYEYAIPNLFILYPYQIIDDQTILMPLETIKAKYPNTYDYLRANKKILEKRKDSRKTFENSDTWYSLTRFGQLNIFQIGEKIIFPGEQKHVKFGFDISQSGYSGARVFGITLENTLFDLKCLLSLLNSSLIEFYIQASFPLRQGGYFSMSSTLVEKLPCSLPLSQKPFVNLVDKILETKKIDPTANTVRWEKQIDIMVYHLYNLNYEEAKIIDPELSEEEFEKYKL